MASVTFDSATGRHPGADRPAVGHVTPQQGHVHLIDVASGERLG